MSKSRLAVSVLPFTLAVLAACGSPAETPRPEQAPVAETAASALNREAVEAAVFETVAAPVEGQPARPDAATARAQILLDRANFSPGVIDGLGGDNTRQAIAAFEKAAGLPQDGVLDAEVFRRLTSGDDGRVLTDYTITAADLAGPFIGQVPADLADMARLQTVGYATPLEMLAEKFHMTEGLLQALNPGVDFGKAGQTIVVAAVAQTELTDDVAHIVVDKAERSVRVYDAADRLLAFYPATIGSSARPAPSGASSASRPSPTTPTTRTGSAMIGATARSSCRRDRTIRSAPCGSTCRATLTASTARRTRPRSARPSPAAACA
jgi:peptidoglycan hydrolase-like protein with peptidoglycan-binding domain